MAITEDNMPLIEDYARYCLDRYRKIDILRKFHKRDENGKITKAYSAERLRVEAEVVYRISNFTYDDRWHLNDIEPEVLSFVALLPISVRDLVFESIESESRISFKRENTMKPLPEGKLHIPLLIYIAKNCGARDLTATQMILLLNIAILYSRDNQFHHRKCQSTDRKKAYDPDVTKILDETIQIFKDKYHLTPQARRFFTQTLIKNGSSWKGKAFELCEEIKKIPRKVTVKEIESKLADMSVYDFASIKAVKIRKRVLERR